MSDQETWLISLSIGPVQDFISAALRTRDLWFGSHMLSEVSKAAAREINKHEAAEFIFPAVDKNSKELEENSQLNVANRIVAQVNNGNKDTVQDIITAGKEAAKERLNTFISEAKIQAKRHDAALRDKEDGDDTKNIWKRQADPDDLLELYGTAVCIKENDYQKAWKRLSQLNSARKNSRDFRQPVQAPNEAGLYGLPKSSLDGRRETVLDEAQKGKEGKEKDKKIRRKLRMGDGEQLDVLGLVKRLAGDNPDQFTPTTRIAIDPWVRKVVDDPTGKASIAAICRNELNRATYKDSGLVTEVGGNRKIYKDLPYDGGLLYRGVLDATVSKIAQEEKSKERDDMLRSLRDLRRNMIPVWENHGQPCPYYAMLLADGDHMGNLIKAAEGKKQHQEISKCLSAFAQGVPATARDHQAHCIYAGGDDVLLMAPLDTVLPLADKLRTAFTEKLQKVADDLGKKAPTFSVGIVIAHMQTPIGRVRRLVREAESLAKGSDTKEPRNALAIIVAPRSGADIPFRARWEKEPVNGLNKLANLYRNDKLPSGFGYELRQIDQLVHDMEDKARAGEIAELEMKRILNRKNQGGGGKKVEQKIKDAVLDHAKSKGSFTMIWQEHLIARWLGAHREERG